MIYFNVYKEVTRDFISKYSDVLIKFFKDIRSVVVGFIFILLTPIIFILLFPFLPYLIKRAERDYERQRKEFRDKIIIWYD